MLQEPHMARKAFVADDAKRERVRYLAGLGVPQNDIARLIGCSPKTLRKRFRDELDRGVAEANAVISGSLFAAAKAGNTTAQIFWLKTRAHWCEGKADDPVPGIDAESTSVVLLLPDNNRDPDLTQVLRDARDNYFARKPRSQPANPECC
jgi:DNA-binding Lrp family transcriptional regulator